MNLNYDVIANSFKTNKTDNLASFDSIIDAFEYAEMKHQTTIGDSWTIFIFDTKTGMIALMGNQCGVFYARNLEK